MTKGVKLALIALTIFLGVLLIVALRGEVSSGSGIASAVILIGAVVVIGACRKIWNYKQKD